jgi:hypothetical protein
VKAVRAPVKVAQVLVKAVRAPVKVVLARAKYLAIVAPLLSKQASLAPEQVALMVYCYS